MPLPLSDHGQEGAVIGYVRLGNFNEIPVHKLIPANAFDNPIWRIIYRTALTIRESDDIVCERSVNARLKETNICDLLQNEIDKTKVISWESWPQDADITIANSPSILPVLDTLKYLHEVYYAREATYLGSQLQAGALSFKDAHKEFKRIEDLLHGSNGHGKIQDSVDLCNEVDDTPPEVVHGIFHQGSKVMLAGGSKSFKTWQLIQLAVCVSAGHQWLKFPTTKGRVLYLNFELPKWAMRKRIQEIRRALGIAPERLTLDVWNLRGHATSADIILPRIARAAAERGYLLIIIDPLYKLLGERFDENSATHMGQLMNEVEQITEQTGAATGFGSHFSKGNQSAKNAIDRMSGSGVLARDPDALIVCTEHAQEDAFTVDMILRNLPKQEQFTMIFKPPIMLVDANLDPKDLKQPTSAGRPSASALRCDQILMALRISRGMQKHELVAITRSSEATVRRDLTKLIRERKVSFSEMDQRYFVTPS